MKKAEKREKKKRETHSLMNFKSSIKWQKDVGSVNNGANDYDPSTSPTYMHFEIKSVSRFYQHMRMLDPNYLPYKH